MKERIDELVRLIKYYDYEFHIKGHQLISEYERDTLRDELMELEHKYPHYIRPDSPTLTIGLVEENRSSIKRSIPMLSLKHSYERPNVIKWIENNRIKPEKHYSYLTDDTYQELQEEFIIESKFDGVAVEIQYVNGIFESLSLRGNGYEGEDISSFAPYIKNLPMKIPHDLSIFIRGEVCLPKDNNKNNKRNIIAGLLRKKIPEKSSAEFIPYGIVVQENTYFSGYKSLDLKFLSTFMNVESYITCSENIIENAETLQNKRFETDGVVIKINYNVNLAHTAKYTKDAIAYKFNNKFYSCTVKNIEWNINRSGNFIPTIIINPIIIEGCNINNITGHNKKFIQNNQIGLDSLLEIERVGGTVPQVKHVLKPGVHINKPENCDHCNFPIEESEIHYTCKNENCPGMIHKRLLYFFQNLDVKGLSHNIIDNIKLQSNYLDSLEYSIKFLLEAQWIENKNHEKALNNLNIIRKTISYNKFIESIGFPGAANLKITKGIILGRLQDYMKENESQLQNIYDLLVS